MVFVRNTALPPAERPGSAQGPSESARGAIIAGWAILIVFFGVIGGWAATAPLNSAIIAEGLVKVEGNRKSVQHLDGGIVKEIRVKNGDRVKEGDILLVLDDGTVRAEHDVLQQQVVSLRATEARLIAERDGADTIRFPEELLSRVDEPSIEDAIAAQRSEFEARRATLAGEQQILDHRMSQLREQIVGDEAQVVSYRAQLRSVVEERRDLMGLYLRGLVSRTRLLQLERNASALEGQIATTLASIRSAHEAIAEYTRQIAQVQSTRDAEVAGDLSATQAKLLDLAPRLQNASVLLGRMEIRSPYAGEVVDLAVFAVGAVIGRGERILDVVPDGTALVVEAQVGVVDISDLRPGMEAELHFTSYKQRSTPQIKGTVSQVSADRLTDERSGAPYYLAEVTVDREELNASPEIQLYPGMPVTVMIPTEDRTALDYLFGPLTVSFDRAFRER